MIKDSTSCITWICRQHITWDHHSSNHLSNDSKGFLFWGKPKTTEGTAAGLSPAIHAAWPCRAPSAREFFVWQSLIKEVEP